MSVRSVWTVQRASSLDHSARVAIGRRARAVALERYSLETVEMFYKDAKAAGYTIQSREAA